MEGVEDGRRADSHGVMSVREMKEDILITVVPRMKHSAMGYHINPYATVVTETQTSQHTRAVGMCAPNSMYMKGARL